jgi:hypothetical protein
MNCARESQNRRAQSASLNAGGYVMALERSRLGAFFRILRNRISALSGAIADNIGIVGIYVRNNS